MDVFQNFLEELGISSDQENPFEMSPKREMVTIDQDVIDKFWSPVLDTSTLEEDGFITSRDEVFDLNEETLEEKTLSGLADFNVSLITSDPQPAITRAAQSCLRFILGLPEGVLSEQDGSKILGHFSINGGNTVVVPITCLDKQAELEAAIQQLNSQITSEFSILGTIGVEAKEIVAGHQSLSMKMSVTKKKYTEFMKLLETYVSRVQALGIAQAEAKKFLISSEIDLVQGELMKVVSEAVDIHQPYMPRDATLSSPGIKGFKQLLDLKNVCFLPVEQSLKSRVDLLSNLSDGTQAALLADPHKLLFEAIKWFAMSEGEIFFFLFSHDKNGNQTTSTCPCGKTLTPISNGVDYNHICRLHKFLTTYFPEFINGQFVQKGSRRMFCKHTLEYLTRLLKSRMSTFFWMRIGHETYRLKLTPEGKHSTIFKMPISTAETHARSCLARSNCPQCTKT